MTQVRLFTVEDYFALERASDVKHEYIDGEIVVMPGASEAHNAIQYRLMGWLFVHFNTEPAPCFVAGSDMRVRIGPTRYTYPDLVVICGPRQYAPDVQPDTLLNPTLIVEILSDSTAEYDQGDKLAFYKQIESLQQVVIVDQARPRIEVHTRADDSWTVTTCAGLDATCTLDAIGVTVPLSDVYRDVTFE